jgi:hypothetical protein
MNKAIPEMSNFGLRMSNELEILPPHISKCLISVLCHHTKYTHAMNNPEDNSYSQVMSSHRLRVSESSVSTLIKHSNNSLCAST